MHELNAYPWYHPHKPKVSDWTQPYLEPERGEWLENGALGKPICDQIPLEAKLTPHSKTEMEHLLLVMTDC